MFILLAAIVIPFLPSHDLSLLKQKECVITEDYDGRIVRLGHNDVLVLKLENRPGAGYCWDVTRTDAGLLLRDISQGKEDGLLGRRSLDIFVFQVLRTGRSRLELDYKGPFKPSERTMRLTVIAD